MRLNEAAGARRTRRARWFVAVKQATESEVEGLFSGPEAEVVEWQTRTFEGRVAQAVRVQVPPSAPIDNP
jgi:hypothetical protein